MDLTRTFTTAEFTRGLEAWGWLDIAAKAPIFASPFGDVFFQAPDGFWWLDTLEGHLSRPWATADALRADLNTPEGQDQYLLAGLAFGAAERGLRPNATQVYGFATPPVLGGAIDLDNVEIIDFVVALHIAGQIHRQVKDLPPGTPISGISITDD